MIFVVPLYSKNVFPDCFDACSQFDNVNVYFISFNPVDEFVENVAALNVFVIAVFAFVSPSTVNDISLVVNVLFDVPVKYLSVAIKSTVTFLFVLSMFIFCVFHTGDTTSTICPLVCPSPVVGSSIPTVSVFATLLFPVVSVTVPSAKASFTIPL